MFPKKRTGDEKGKRGGEGKGFKSHLLNCNSKVNKSVVVQPHPGLIDDSHEETEPSDS